MLRASRQMPFRISLRSMAVLVGRAKMIKAGEGRETARRLGREQLIFELIFLAALPLVLARFAREFRGFPPRAPGSTKPPCYAG